MTEAAICGHRLEGVTNGVPEVEHSPKSTFLFIGGHDARFEAATRFDDRRQLGDVLLKLQQWKREQAVEQSR